MNLKEWNSLQPGDYVRESDSTGRVFEVVEVKQGKTSKMPNVLRLKSVDFSFCVSKSWPEFWDRIGGPL